jgi:hypothetical protein
VDLKRTLRLDIKLLFNSLILTGGRKGLNMGVGLLGSISRRKWMGLWGPIGVLIEIIGLDHLPIHLHFD